MISELLKLTPSDIHDPTVTFRKPKSRRAGIHLHPAEPCGETQRLYSGKLDSSQSKDFPDMLLGSREMAAKVGGVVGIYLSPMI
jgi:hypothetical protein